MNHGKFEIIVIGGGHAGCEAVLAGARRGFKTLLLTSNIDQIGAMSCNPAIGGLGKGHLVREIDALGGEMGQNIDETGIQFRRLNTNKGAAVQGTRAQADKYLYRDRMRWILENTQNLTIKQGTVKKIIVKNFRVQGIELTSGDEFSSETVVVTTGTFLRGICHVGMKNFSGGRAGDSAALDLSGSLIQDCGLELMRLKTGTVPRLDGRTIRWDDLEEQIGDQPLPFFSFRPTQFRQKQISCFITYTTPETHEIIKQDLHKSPLFQGVIKGVGPRYCPSIEDKVVRFADKDRHQIFLEPEGLRTREIYPNGLSTSLPLETQIAFIRSIPGCEKAEITRPGYAVEYDAASPVQLKKNLETKNIKGLFLAGQINGTSGYEEAAAQGLIAGINAGQYIREEDPFVLTRDSSYIGVMIDDLVTKGVGGEPYRMFTSRAEYRMALREDNADLRLTPIGHELGLVSQDEFLNFEKRVNNLGKWKSHGESQRIKTGHVVYDELTKLWDKSLGENPTILQIFRWPEFQLSHLKKYWSDLGFENNYNSEDALTFLSDIKYAGYIQRYQREIKKMEDYDSIRIPIQVDYMTLPSLSTEVRQKLERHRPETLGQALRIPGVTPAAIAHLEIFISSKKFFSNPSHEVSRGTR